MNYLLYTIGINIEINNVVFNIDVNQLCICKHIAVFNNAYIQNKSMYSISSSIPPSGELDTTGIDC